MPQKAVSPLIATVLVIGFAIALSGIMMTWGTSFVKDIQERSEKSSLKDIACTKDVGLNIKSATVFGNKIKLVVENLGQMNMDKLNILLVGSDGGENIVTGSGISAGGIQSFSVALDPNKIGTFKQVEIIPYITFEGEQIACKDAVDKEENLPIDTDGLVAYYKLDGDAKDSAGNNNGVINGNPVTVNGVFGNALNFDGDGDYFIRNPFNNFPTSEISVEFWMKSSDTSKAGTPVSYASASSQNEMLIFDYRAFIVYRGATSSTTGISANDGIWHFIRATWKSSGQVVLYKDGGIVFTGTLAAGTSITGGGSLVFAQEQDSIGDAFESVQAFIGTMDEVKIYNKAKTY